MFGILHALFAGFVAIGGKISNDWDNNGRRIDSKNRGYMTYFDSTGRERLVSNNRKVYVSTCTGRRLLRDVETNEIYYDYTAEAERKKEKELDEKGIEYELIYCEKELTKAEKETDWGKIFSIYKQYHLFRDRKTKKMYNIVSINIPQNCKAWFMIDMESGYICGLWDNENRKAIKHLPEKIGDLYVKKIFTAFNKLQDQRKIQLQSSEFFADDYYLLKVPRIIMDNNYEIKMSVYYKGFGYMDMK